MHRLKLSLFDLFNGVGMALLCFTTVYPLLHIFSLSLSSPLEARKGGFMLYPRDISFESYLGLVKDHLFWNSYLNILLVTMIGVAGCLLIVAMASYVLSLPYFPFRKSITFFIALTMFFQAGLIPSYLLIRYLGLMNTWYPLWVPGATSAFNVLILINFFRQTPAEIREAAVMDGASEMTVFLRIILPLSKPVLATVSLFLAVMFWNDWYSPYLYINDNHLFTLPLILRKYVVDSDMGSFSGFVQSETNQVLPEQLRATVILVSLLPTLVMYPFVQRFFVKGITLGSLKG